MVSRLLLVRSYVLVNSLDGNHVVAFDLAIADYLFRRPLMLPHITVYAVLHFPCKGASRAQTFFTNFCQHLRMRITVHSVYIAIALEFPTYDRFVFVYGRSNFFCLNPCRYITEIVYLCSLVSCAIFCNFWKGATKILKTFHQRGRGNTPSLL